MNLPYTYPIFFDELTLAFFNVRSELTLSFLIHAIWSYPIFFNVCVQSGLTLSFLSPRQRVTLSFLTFSAVVTAAGVWYGRHVYRSTEKSKGCRLIYDTWVRRAWASFPAYVVQRVTLSFFTFSAVVAAPGWGAYRWIENPARFRTVYDTWGAPRRGGCQAAPARVNLP